MNDTQFLLMSLLVPKSGLRNVSVIVWKGLLNLFSVSCALWNPNTLGQLGVLVFYALWLLCWWQSDKCWCLKICPAGVDPKSILCEFFKAGQCQKGFKCKFSHDLNVQRKGEKIDIYTDKRDAGIGPNVQTWLGYHLLLFKWFWINSYAICYGQKPWRTGIRRLSRRLLNRRRQSISRTNLLILYALL
jgi:hypothetical protein